MMIMFLSVVPFGFAIMQLVWFDMRFEVLCIGL